MFYKNQFCMKNGYYFIIIIIIVIYSFLGNSPASEF